MPVPRDPPRLSWSGSCRANPNPSRVENHVRTNSQGCAAVVGHGRDVPCGRPRRCRGRAGPRAQRRCEVHGLPRCIERAPAPGHRPDEARDAGRRPHADLHELPRRKQGPRRTVGFPGQARRHLRQEGQGAGERAERSLPQLPPEGLRAPPVGGQRSRDPRRRLCLMPQHPQRRRQSPRQGRTSPKSATPATRRSASRRTSPGTTRSPKAR